MINSANPTLAEAELRLFNHFVGQVGRSIGQPIFQSPATFQWDGAKLELIPLVWEHNKPAVLFVFTLMDFKLVDAATLAQLLHLNRDLLKNCQLPACFALDESGHHVQFQQRMLLDEVPVWALQRYIQDSLTRLRDLFVLAAIAS